jgi:D-glycero-alpha-D-manno-heptose-7-phosphate kinase
MAEMLAREAAEMEIHRLGKPVGKQDHYIAAYGGLICQEYRPNDDVVITPLRISEAALLELRDSLMLFFVGYTRNASDLLQEQKTRSERGDAQMLESLHLTKRIAIEIRQSLEAADVRRLGDLMHEHWLSKRSRSVGMTNKRIDELYDLARSRGAVTGGKLVGAGGSGFLLFHTADRRRLRTLMTEAGLREMDFSFDFDGSAVLLRNT